MMSYLEQQIESLQDKLTDVAQDGRRLDSKLAGVLIRRFMMNVCLDTFENEDFRKELMVYKAAES